MNVSTELVVILLSDTTRLPSKSEILNHPAIVSDFLVDSNYKTQTSEGGSIEVEVLVSGRLNVFGVY